MGKGKADGVGFLRKVVGLPSRSGRARNPPPGYLTMTPHREVEGEVPLEEERAGGETLEDEVLGGEPLQGVAARKSAPSPT